MAIKTSARLANEVLDIVLHDASLRRAVERELDRRVRAANVAVQAQNKLVSEFQKWGDDLP